MNQLLTEENFRVDSKKIILWHFEVIYVSIFHDKKIKISVELSELELPSTDMQCIINVGVTKNFSSGNRIRKNVT